MFRMNGFPYSTHPELAPPIHSSFNDVQDERIPPIPPTLNWRRPIPLILNLLKDGKDGFH